MNGGGVHPRHHVSHPHQVQPVEPFGRAAPVPVNIPGQFFTAQHRLRLGVFKFCAVEAAVGVHLHHALPVQYQYPRRFPFHVRNGGAVDGLGVPGAKIIGQRCGDVLRHSLVVLHLLIEQIVAHQPNQRHGHHSKGHGDDQQVGDQYLPPNGVEGIFNPCQ